MVSFTYYYVAVDSASEQCYYLEYTGDLNIEILENLVGKLHKNSTLTGVTIEVGPKLTFKSSWCSNALRILNKCGLSNITRIEKSYRTISQQEYDQMTEEVYPRPLTSFGITALPEKPYTVKLADIESFNKEHGLGWDREDLAFYSGLFTTRDPTNVELIDLAQSNSEHSRHHFFAGKHIIDGVAKEKTLFQLIKNTLPKNSNSKSAFCDNASAISGWEVSELTPQLAEKASSYHYNSVHLHPTFTAETHNFPTGIAPFPGAATGVGGRIRDTIAIGRGGRMVAGLAGYCVADKKLLVQASDGASDYGNKIGEPIIQGFTRFFDSTVNGERWAWIKPIMFSGGVGVVSDRDLKKLPGEPGMAIVRIGGPAYRIGVGGSTASSQHQGNDHKHLSAVQRGDPEMENRMCSAIRAMIEGSENPIISIHDQGAGGTANVTKEIVEACGGIVDIRNITSGDETLSTLEKWVAEYQEQVTILVKPFDLEYIQNIASRENIDAIVFGYTTSDGMIRVKDDSGEPVCLVLSKIFSTPQKVYNDHTIPTPQHNFKVPAVNFIEALKKVFRLESVGSKRFLTDKVDRSVSGLIVQQQCVGPLSTPISDYALVAHSHFSHTGTATSIGEQPIKSFADPRRCGELAVIEMLTNLMWVKISSLADIKCSVNWMWPAKLPGENAAMYQCMEGLQEYMLALGISADGGKDSVSMYTRREDTIIKSPRSVVVSAYVTVPNIYSRVTPDLKGDGMLLHLLPSPVSLGCSAFAQAYATEGGDIHIPSAEQLKKLFYMVQILIKEGLISAGHDISDGGLITTIIEMAIAGNVGIRVDTQNDYSALEWYFSESPGVIIEIPTKNFSQVKHLLSEYSVNFIRVGETFLDSRHVFIYHNNELILEDTLGNVRGWWEELSREYKAVQSTRECAEAEWQMLVKGEHPKWSEFSILPAPVLSSRPRIAVVRDEGSNGAREMAAAWVVAGFDAWDLTMSDILEDSTLLSTFRGIAFVGGFTYADVFGAGVGWAAQIKHSPQLSEAFQRFKDRPDTFSLGICNGCQLMTCLGWVPECKFIKNTSGVFESRVSTVKVHKSNSIMLRGMDGASYGVWIAHAEGKLIGKVPEECIALQYVDNNLEPTEVYPHNPNGSEKGVTGVCSPCGRHLAMMPHPERSWQRWQMPWLPQSTSGEYTFWFKMFANAYEWSMGS